jgi:hypothetical protein
MKAHQDANGMDGCRYTKEAVRIVGSLVPTLTDEVIQEDPPIRALA